ncbi:hypothetical protein [Alphaproteobacteria bacterium endosymbiont of Tiliacea citrago]|uniref:hypothetical protein n=1 Tax=Alphaproteobacteria bacterium endosymbiont of Tiliacea citrago TaxID=3077944 RepID=UPI00313B8583
MELSSSEKEFFNDFLSKHKNDFDNLLKESTELENKLKKEINIIDIFVFSEE